MSNTQSERLSPEDVPWQTAPEIVQEIAAELEVSDDLQLKAMDLATEYGLNGELGRTPKVIAASSIYLAGLLCNEKQTQPEVVEASGASDVAIRQTYDLIAVAEGIRAPREQREKDAEQQEQEGNSNPINQITRSKP